jgi:hypothetical protein
MFKLRLLEHWRETFKLINLLNLGNFEKKPKKETRDYDADGKRTTRLTCPLEGRKISQ